MQADSLKTVIGGVINRMTGLSRQSKIALQIFADGALILGCFLLAMTLRLETLTWSSNPKVWLVLAAALTGLDRLKQKENSHG